MAESFATIEDFQKSFVGNVQAPTSEDLVEKVEDILKNASNYLRVKFYGIELDLLAQRKELVREALKTTTVALARREYDSATSDISSLENFTQAAGPYSFSGKPLAGGFYLRKEELENLVRILMPGRSRIRFVKQF